MLYTNHTAQELTRNHMLRFEDSDDAIIGFAILADGNKAAVYNYYDLLQIHSQYFITTENPREEAAKWIEYLKETTHGMGAPIVIYPSDADMLDLIENTEVRH